MRIETSHHLIYLRIINLKLRIKSKFYCMIGKVKLSKTYLVHHQEWRYRRGFVNILPLQRMNEMRKRGRNFSCSRPSCKHTNRHVYNMWRETWNNLTYSQRMQCYWFQGNIFLSIIISRKACITTFVITTRWQKMIEWRFTGIRRLSLIRL